MHDIRAIRDDPAAFDAALSRRGVAPQAAALLALDEARRAAIAAADEAAAEQNRAAREVGAAKARGDEEGFERLRALVGRKKAEGARLAEEARADDARWRPPEQDAPAARRAWLAQWESVLTGAARDRGAPAPAVLGSPLTRPAWRDGLLDAMSGGLCRDGACRFTFAPLREAFQVDAAWLENRRRRAGDREEWRYETRHVPLRPGSSLTVSHQIALGPKRHAP